MRRYFKEHLLPLLRPAAKASLESLDENGGALGTQNVTIQRETELGSYTVIMPPRVRKPGYTISVWTLAGNKVYGISNLHSQKLELDMGGFKPGVYMLEILSGDDLLKREFLRN